MPDHAAVHEQVEVVRDRNPFAVRHEVDQAAGDRHRQAAFLRRRDLVVVRLAHAPRRTEERLPEEMVKDADRRTVGRRHVVARAAGIEDGARLQPEELLGLRLVGEEADVLLDRHLLLAHERHRAAQRRLAGRERRDAIQVRDRPDQLIDEIPVVLKAVVPHGKRS